MVIVSQIPVAVAKAYSPGHVTGFFATKEGVYSDADSKLQGSLGAGFSIDKGITSIVKIFPSSSKKFEIKLNGSSNYDLKVSRFVVEYYLQIINYPVFISVEHETNLPIGFGLGSSGSAALSLSYALNKSLKTNFTKIEAAQIAHHADLTCRTGLGTVISEYTGGFELRLSMGGPGIGRVVKTPLSPEWKAIIMCFKPIETNFLLNNFLKEEKRRYLNQLGEKMMNELSQNPKVDTFLNMSHLFASEYGLVNGICAEPLHLLNLGGVQASVALFGYTLFTLAKGDKLSAIVRILSQFNGELLVCDIDNLGARLIGKTG